MRATPLFWWFVRFAVVLPALATGAELPAAPENGGPRNFEVSAVGGLNLRERPTTAATVLARYPDGIWLDNLGCLEAEGRAWCDVQKLGGGPRGYVAAEFLRPAIHHMVQLPRSRTIRRCERGRAIWMRGVRCPVQRPSISQATNVSSVSLVPALAMPRWSSRILMAENAPSFFAPACRLAPARARPMAITSSAPRKKAICISSASAPSVTRWSMRRCWEAELRTDS